MHRNERPPGSAVDLLVLASGSQANALWIRAFGCALLLDAGLTADATLRRLDEAGLPASDIEAVVLTHEHDDHARGAGAVARAVGAAVAANQQTLEACPGLDGVDTIRVQSERPLKIGPFEIEAIPVSHDAAAPSAFAIQTSGLRVVLATDLGSVNDQLIERARGADVIILEANYDLRLLNVSPYPWFLKNRILGANGHLSNDAAAKAIVAMHAGRSQEVLLAHLSEINNLAPLARDSVLSALAEASVTRVNVQALRPNRGGTRLTLPLQREAVGALARS
jgi:phosphoribosyl 1,2-cyclic phosphodiesterase